MMLEQQPRLNTTQFVGLKLEKKQDYLEQYFNLILNLYDNKEEFIMEIKNPFNNRQFNLLEMYAQQMNIVSSNCDKFCGDCESFRFVEYLTINECIDQIIKYGLNKIQIDSINILFDNRACKHYYQGFDITEDIDLRDIECNNVEICYQDNIEQELFLNITLIIEYPLKLLKIQMKQDYFLLSKYSLDLVIDFQNESTYISKLEIQLPPSYVYDYISYYDSHHPLIKEEQFFKDLFSHEKILEYELNFQQVNYQLFQSLLQIDQECEKIIFFSKYNKENEHFENFVQLRNNINSLRYQLIIFDKTISYFLKYSPTFTFLDLHLDMLLD